MITEDPGRSHRSIANELGIVETGISNTLKNRGLR